MKSLVRAYGTFYECRTLHPTMNCGATSGCPCRDVFLVTQELELIAG
ncbi:MAG: hypothetical protein WD139_01660 [Balneolaceae bacterium]